MGWEIDLFGSHQAQCHAYEPAAHAKVCMLSVGFASLVVCQKIFWTIAADMMGRLNNLIFENMIASLADMANPWLAFGSAGLFDSRYDTGIGY